MSRQNLACASARNRPRMGRCWLHSLQTWPLSPHFGRHRARIAQIILKSSTSVVKSGGSEQRDTSDAVWLTFRVRPQRSTQLARRVLRQVRRRTPRAGKARPPSPRAPSPTAMASPVASTSNDQPLVTPRKSRDPIPTPVPDVSLGHQVFVGATEKG